MRGTHSLGAQRSQFVVRKPNAPLVRGRGFGVPHSIHQESISISDLAKRCNVASIELPDTANPTALILPTDPFQDTRSKERLLFARYAKEICAELSENGVPTTLYTDDRNAMQVIRRSADIVLPIILFIGSLPMGILGRWTYDRLIKNEDDDTTIIELPLARVEKDSDDVNLITITGNGSEVIRILRELGASIDEVENTTTLSPESWKGRCEKSANQHLIEARNLIDQADAAQVRKHRLKSETLLRSALDEIRKAVLYVPTNAEFKNHLHQIGKRVHDEFGCVIRATNGQYSITCPVQLSHVRGGVSIGGYGQLNCSICGGNMFQCDHIAGRQYNNVIAQQISDRCNICTDETCEHEIGTTHDNVLARAIITTMELDHLAFVERPADPLCTFNEFPISKNKVYTKLKGEDWDRFEYGRSAIRCHHCVNCTGYDGKASTIEFSL